MDSFQGWCTDFYVNQKLEVTLNLPASREPVLELFDRVRREVPALRNMRRAEAEVALESDEQDDTFQWVALRQTSLRSGIVNPPGLSDAYRLHRFLLDTAPYFLSISPLDVDHLDLVFGFDLETNGPRDAIVADALLKGSPIGALVEGNAGTCFDMQPFVGFTLPDQERVLAYVEVKTRPARPEAGWTRRGKPEPEHEPQECISVYLTVRCYSEFRRIEDLATQFGMLCGHAERLAEERVIPNVVMPLKERIDAD